MLGKSLAAAAATLLLAAPAVAQQPSAGNLERLGEFKTTGATGDIPHVPRDKDRVADAVKAFAPNVDFTLPNGVCLSKDGFLFVAEQNRALVFLDAEFFDEGADVAAVFASLRPIRD
jgi:hypothetical protein